MTSATGTKTIVVIRHGNKDGDQLTETGFNQITALGSFIATLGLNFVRAYWSGAQRTLQTINTAMDACGQPMVAPIEDQRAGMEDLLAANTAGFMAEFKQASAVIKESCPEGATAADYLAHWPTAAILKQRLEALMQEDIAGIKDGEAIVIASHSPTAELAVLNPERCKVLAEGDAVMYTFQDGRLIESCRITNPYQA